jgi:enamine deaminase RidA (YjgF/YER057c/UK114 family)
MTFNTHNYEDLGARVEISAFAPADKVKEYHVMIHVEGRAETFQQQLQRLQQAEQQVRSGAVLSSAQVVFKRYLLSDSTNQVPLIHDGDACTISFIQQSPLDGSKLALWLYMVEGAEVVYNADTFHSTVVRHNGYEHIWTMGMMNTKGNSYDQTDALLDDYETLLDQKYGANIADNCIRTWFFVRDVDTNYAGLVVARRENFELHGLTSYTHYIASTGIGGSPSNTKALVQLGSYALTGIQPEQQQYLYALSHLNRTIEYGVTFERGTRVKYGDRSHLYISGTASIDNKGQVLHVGDVRQQTLRMWENVEQLLAEGGATYQDVAHIIVYLRDVADYPLVSQMFAERFPHTPYAITLAPVCRPTWLIEMECVAITPDNNTEYKEF